jgi:hypothetical protein
MAFVLPNAEQTPYALRAIKAAITAAGPMHDLQRRALSASQKYLLRTGEDIDALAPIDPAELARAIREPSRRRPVVQAMCAYMLVGDAVKPEHLSVIDRYARVADRSKALNT